LNYEKNYQAIIRMHYFLNPARTTSKGTLSPILFFMLMFNKLNILFKNTMAFILQFNLKG